MMKKLLKILGSIAFTAVLVFSMGSCATIDDIINPKALAFDKSVPKDQMATLHYCTDIRVLKLDGKENLSPLGLGAISYQGVGDIVEKDVSILKSKQEYVIWYPEPKKGALRIPAGERTLTGTCNYGTGWSDPIELKYTFAPGKHYFINTEVDPAWKAEWDAKYNAITDAKEAAQFAASAFTAETKYIFTCEDITNPKGKAYERSDKKK